MKHFLADEKVKAGYSLPRSIRIYLKGIIWLVTKPHSFVQKTLLVLQREAIIRQYNRSYRLYLRKVSNRRETVRQQKENILRLAYQPKISILLPTYNTPIKYLRICIESVLKQSYDNWELCIADDCSTDKEVSETLDEYRRIDKRIKVILKKRNTHISDTTNTAFSLATGQYVALLDHDDVLYPDTLYEYVLALNAHTRPEVLYCDEDKIKNDGSRVEPHFKPGWSPHTLLACNYITHFLCMKRELYEAVGGCRVGFEGAQDYDLVLRATDKAKKIQHIPKILYSWRILPESTASQENNAKLYAYDNGAAALSAYIENKGLNGKAAIGVGRGLYKLELESKVGKAVILVHDRTNKRLPLRTLPANGNMTLGQNLAKILIDSDSTHLLFLGKELVCKDPAAFAEQSLSLLQLNNAVMIGTKIRFRNRKIFHTGYIFFRRQGRLSVMDAFRNIRTGGYFNFNYSKILRNYSAVSALGASISLDFYRKSLSKSDLQLLQTVETYKDLGLLLGAVARRNDKYIASFPGSITIENNSPELEAEASQELLSLWDGIIGVSDPFYNENLSVDTTDFSISRRLLIQET